MLPGSVVFAYHLQACRAAIFGFQLTGMRKVLMEKHGVFYLSDLGNSKRKVY